MTRRAARLGTYEIFIPSTAAPAAPPCVRWPPQGDGTGLRAESGRGSASQLGLGAAQGRWRAAPRPWESVKCLGQKQVNSKGPTCKDGVRTQSDHISGFLDRQMVVNGSF